ncbi:MAG: peptidoglycan-binding protein [Betaproteobacteria bacterium]|nr:peptidoglycan-binding protein [Betaproteobacteria bacterium]
MDVRFLAVAALLAAGLAHAGDEITSLHPEHAIPDDLPRMTAPGPFSGMISNVQQKLRQLGFDAGPVNGDYGTKTQAAVAQFQRANDLPVSGMLDAQTLNALDVPLEQQAMAPSAGEEDANTGR